MVIKRRRVPHGGLQLRTSFGQRKKVSEEEKEIKFVSFQFFLISGCFWVLPLYPCLYGTAEAPRAGTAGRCSAGRGAAAGTGHALVFAAAAIDSEGLS